MISRRCLAALLSMISATTTIPAQEWPRFRGPNGSGISAATTITAEWKDADYSWKFDLPGRGHSSPVLWGKQVYVTSANEKTGQRFLTCIHADTGKQLWQRDYAGQKGPKHEDNSFASATPAADNKHLYVTWGNNKEYLVLALNHAGAEVWRHDLGPYKGGHGFGASPIVHEDVVVVPNEQDGASAVVGLDRHTGEIRWKTPRKSKSTYSTPCIYQPKGGPAELIVTSYEHGVSSIDPATGKVNWELDVFNKGHIESSIASPVTAGELLLATSGWLAVRYEVIAVAPPVAQPMQSARKLYTLDQSAPLCVTPLIKDGLVYMWSDKGVVTCADAKDGKVHWQKRVAGSFYSSPVYAGNMLINLSREGEAVVLAAGKKYEPLAQNSLHEGTHATSALAHGRLYVRTFTRLLSIGGKKQ